MLIKRAFDIPSSEITSENLYHNRREFIKTASAVLGIAAAGSIIPGCAPTVGAFAEPQAKKPGAYDTTEKVTPYEDITTYNNYYEFGTDKADPSSRLSTGRTSKVCAWMKPQTRSPFSQPGSMGNRSRTRTARHCVWLPHGSMASRVSRRSSTSASRTSSL